MLKSLGCGRKLSSCLNGLQRHQGLQRALRIREGTFQEETEVRGERAGLRVGVPEDTVTGFRQSRGVERRLRFESAKS